MKLSRQMLVRVVYIVTVLLIVEKIRHTICFQKKSMNFWNENEVYVSFETLNLREDRK